MTIHEVKGSSMDRAVMDIGSDVSAHGKAYVVLSTLIARGDTQQLNGSVLQIDRPTGVPRVC
jgi:hypothetical protein